MSDTPRTDFVAHESGDPEWNRFPNRFARMMSHAQILERENARLREALTMAKEYIFNPFEKDNQCNTYHRICAVLREIEGKS